MNVVYNHNVTNILTDETDVVTGGCRVMDVTSVNDETDEMV